MVSNTRQDGQIVVSEETTLISPPNNTCGSNKYDLAESSSSIPKNEEQMEISVQHANDNVENKGVVAENLSSANASEEEMNICDTCGDLGDKDSLVICSKCEVGAEHTYCMMVKINDPPNEWYCYDCTKDKDGLGNGEEISPMKRKYHSFIDFFKMNERALSEEQSQSLNAQNTCKSGGLDLNIDLNLDLYADPNINMNVESNSKKRKAESSIDFFKISEKASSPHADWLDTQNRGKILGFDLNKIPNLDLNAEPSIDLNAETGIDLNVDLNIDLNVDPDLNMNMGSYLNL